MKTTLRLILLTLLPLGALTHAQDVVEIPTEPTPKADETTTGEQITEKSPGGLPGINVDVQTPEAKAGWAKFKALPKEKQNEFEALMVEAQRLFKQKRTQEGLEKMNEAELIWAEHPNLLNIKGAALVKLKDYDRAADYFAKGVKLYPNFWQSRFNLAEMHFVRKNWKEAHKMFEELLGFKSDTIAPATRRLLDYKVILCLIKQGEAEKAQKRIDNYDIYDDTPIYYYSLAATYFEKGDKAKGEEWVRNARRVYQKQLNAIFEDALTELGWLFVF